MKVNKKALLKSLAVTTLSFFTVVGVLSAATTIGTSIDTAGSLSVNNATSTINNLAMINATSTNATTTKLYVSSTIIAAGNVAAGTTSVPVSGEIIASHASATTTLNLFAAGSNKGGCIQLTGPANAAYRVYVGGAGDVLIVQAGNCK